MDEESVATGEEEEAEGEAGLVEEAEEDVGELGGLVKESPAALRAELPQDGNGVGDNGLVIGRKRRKAVGWQGNRRVM